MNASQATLTPVLPHVFPEFRHVLHHWNHHRQSHLAHILPGQFYVSKEPILITTIVGSCIAVCIFDNKAKIGGMNHFMLPINNDTTTNLTNQMKEAGRYGDMAIQALLNSIIRHGGQKENFEVKIFGGAKILPAMPDIGLQNIDFILNYIKTEHLRLINQDVGGILPRRIVFSPISGRAQIKKLYGQHERRIATREEKYLHDLQQQPDYSNMHVLRGNNEKD